jgi:hypothetical protein
LVLAGLARPAWGLGVKVAEEKAAMNNARGDQLKRRREALKAKIEDQPGLWRFD